MLGGLARERREDADFVVAAEQGAEMFRVVVAEAPAEDGEGRQDRATEEDADDGQAGESDGDEDGSS